MIDSSSLNTKNSADVVQSLMVYIWSTRVRDNLSGDARITIIACVSRRAEIRTYIRHD